MIVLGIDPGPTHSAWVQWGGTVRAFGYEPNAQVEVLCREGHLDADVLAMERPQAYGGRCSPALLDTTWEAAVIWSAWRWHRIDRHQITYGEVSQHHTGKRGSKEADVRAALIERLGPVGTKKNPGPLYGLRVKDHTFSALAVAVAVADRLEGKK